MLPGGDPTKPIPLVADKPVAKNMDHSLWKGGKKESTTGKILSFPANSRYGFRRNACMCVRVC